MSYLLTIIVPVFNEEESLPARRMLINDGIADTCLPLKILETSYARSIPFFKGMHRFIPALVQLPGGTVKQVSVSHYSRAVGTAKYHLFNRLVGPFYDTLAFVWILKRWISYSIEDEDKFSQIQNNGRSSSS